MTDPTFEVRPATTEDLQRIEAFIEPFVAEGRILPRTRDELLELVEHSFVAEREERLVGFAALEIYSSKLGEIRSLAVDPSERGRGIGRTLVEACLSRARRQEVFEVMVVTSEDGFFQQCGFDYTLPGERRALFHQTRETH